MKKIGWAFVIVVLVLGGVGFWFFKAKKEKAVDYTAVQVSKGNLQKSILTTGLVQPYNRLEIKPPIAGRAEEVLVEEGNKVVKGQILAWMSSTERATLLDAARAQGPAAVKRWEELFKPTPLLAPLDGMIIAKNVQSGQTVTQQDAVLVMSDKLIVKAQVDETDIGEVKLGQKAQIILDAYSQQKIPAKVGHIAFEAKVVNNVTVYEVDVVPDQVPEEMRSGMTANVTFYVSEREKVLWLPQRAIQKQSSGNYVAVGNPADPDKIQMKPVELGLSDGKRVEILSGLQEGETVLIQNTDSKPAAASAGQSNPLSPMRGGRPARR